MNMKHAYIPILSSPAGSCLTAANWQEVGITTVAYSLEALLLKPGISVLNKFDLKAYLGWSGNIILTAQDLKPNTEGLCTLISTYDGSRLKITVIELVELIKHLNPNAVVLPENIQEQFPELFTNWPDTIKLLQESPASDEPAKAAMQGIVYTKEGDIDLTDPKFQMQFTNIDDSCSCPTCNQKLSKAYLHHLLIHTPLLCQRFLIQHNAFFSFTL